MRVALPRHPAHLLHPRLVWPCPQSAALGLAVAGALALGYSNIFVTAPSPENLRTLFEFVFKGLDELGYKVGHRGLGDRGDRGVRIPGDRGVGGSGCRGLQAGPGAKGWGGGGGEGMGVQAPACLCWHRAGLRGAGGQHRAFKTAPAPEPLRMAVALSQPAAALHRGWLAGTVRQ